MPKLDKYDCPVLAGLPILKKPKLTVHIHFINITVFSAEKRKETMAESPMSTYTLISKSPSKAHDPDRLLLSTPNQARNSDPH